ncbi:hypothetical protein HBN50_02675 [Halobacteriovorax sp. GB3]|uniref:hypothetical protein n=1 Tax=Halobacteriovorax sp. GB3 TaxID=2719615 RepID=UPI002363127E|nr:hypothetical protein [Halobacteriovorax sp. GB3]MDD0851979.1 hypothetical protein [Halobacteriovorax sp. GB3]
MKKIIVLSILIIAGASLYTYLQSDIDDSKQVSIFKEQSDNNDERFDFDNQKENEDQDILKESNEDLQLIAQSLVKSSSHKMMKEILNFTVQFDQLKEQKRLTELNEFLPQINDELTSCLKIDNCGLKRKKGERYFESDRTVAHQLLVRVFEMMSSLIEEGFQPQIDQEALLNAISIKTSEIDVAAISLYLKMNFNKELIVNVAPSLTKEGFSSLFTELLSDEKSTSETIHSLNEKAGLSPSSSLEYLLQNMKDGQLENQSTIELEEALCQKKDDMGDVLWRSSAYNFKRLKSQEINCPLN